MTASLRILCRMFGAFYSRGITFYLLALWAGGFVFLGLSGGVQRSMGSFPVIAILAPFLFAASNQYGRELEAGRMRALLALPIPPRTLATWWWLSGCMGLAAIAEGAAFLLNQFRFDPSKAQFVPDATHQPGIFIALASVIFLGMLVSHVVSTAARRRDWPWLESLGAPVCVLGAVVLCLYATGRAIPSADVAIVVPVAAAGLAVAGWLASPILLPSHSFLDPRRRPRPSRKSTARDGAQDGRRTGGYRIAPSEWLAPIRKNAIWGAVFAVAFSPALWLFAVRRVHPLASRDGLQLVGMMAPMLDLWFVIIVLVTATQRVHSARSMRALPWRRSDMTAYFASIPLAAFGGVLVVDSIVSAICAACGLEDPLRSSAPVVWLLAGACLTALPVRGRLGLSAALGGCLGAISFVGSHLFAIGMAGFGFWPVAAGLLIGGLSLRRFHAQLDGTEIYRRPAEAGDRRL